MRGKRKSTSLLVVLTIVMVSQFLGSTSLAAPIGDNKNNIQGEINLLSIIEDNSRTPKDVEVKGPFTLHELAKELAAIEEISVDEAIKILSSKNGGIQTMAQRDYYTYTRSVRVTSEYRPKVTFYCEVLRQDFQVLSFFSVKHASLDRKYNGMSKQFGGELYYNLERNDRLYYELNGDFYDNGTTTSSGGFEIGLGDEAKIKFNISYSSNFYEYCSYRDRIYASDK